MKPGGTGQRKFLGSPAPVKYPVHMGDARSTSLQRAALSNQELHVNAMVGLIPTMEMQQAKEKRVKTEKQAKLAEEANALRERQLKIRAYAKKAAATPIQDVPEVPETVFGVNEFLEWRGNVLYGSAEDEEFVARREADEAKKPFAVWLFKDGPPPTRMNCWESVLYSAFTAGIITKAYIKKAIQAHPDTGLPRFISAILKAPAGKIDPSLKGGYYDPEELKNKAIPAGNVVLFGSGSDHVALSSGPQARVDGSGFDHGIIELNNDTTGVERTTLEKAYEKRGYFAKGLAWGRLPALGDL